MSVVPQISREALLAQLRDAVGAAHVLTDDQATRRFRKGHRTGEGPVLAVVRPGTLLEQWKGCRPLWRRAASSSCRRPTRA